MDIEEGKVESNASSAEDTVAVAKQEVSKSKSSPAKKKTAKSEEKGLIDERAVRMTNLMELKKRYAGKKVVLTPRTVMWGIGGMMLSNISPDGKAANIGTIPEDLALADYATIARAVNQGIISVEEKDIQRYAKYKATVEDITDEQTIQVHSDIEEALIVDIEEFPATLRKLRTEGRTDDFFKMLLEEEKRGANREEYIKEIEKALGIK